MSTHGFLPEDDLILYAMQALPPAEMDAVARRIAADPELKARLSTLEQTLGLYGAAAVTLEPVPAGALQRLEREIAGALTPAPAPVPLPDRTPVESPRQAVSSAWWRFGLFGAGWALAAALLVAFLQQHGRVQNSGNTIASQQEEIRSAEQRLQSAQQAQTSLQADRDRLQAALSKQSSRAEQSQRAADLAQSRSDSLDAKASAAADRAAQESARADSLAASAARDAASQRAQLSAALGREQQAAAEAARSRQVLAALADPTALRVTLTVPRGKKQPSGRGTYLASNGTLVFTGSDLDTPPPGKVYELWLLPADGSAPVPAGTFSPDIAGNVTVINGSFQQRVAAKGFAITLEPAGGSTTPTMPILLAGTT